MNPKYRAVLLSFLVVLQLPTIAWASESELRDFASVQLKVLFQAIRDKSPPEEVDRLLQRTVDFQRITHGVIGAHSKALSKTQVTRFQRVFQDSIHRLLVKALADLKSLDLAIGRIVFKGDDRAQVSTVVSSSGNQRFEVVASVARPVSDWQVRNLIVNGVNLGVTFRNQFDHLMMKHGEAELAIDAWADSLGNPTL